MKRFTRVADYMTPDPHTIGLDQNLAAAERCMKELHVRQLPVIHEGALRGTISERDVALVRSLDLDLREVGVEEALTFEPYTVSADAPLGRVVRTMAAHRYGCAVVVQENRVRGIFTATDALRAMAELLDRYEPGQAELTPSEVRELVLTEHQHLRQLIAHALVAARQVSSGDAHDEDIQAMRGAARCVYTALVAHTELEDHMLVPLLETLDAQGRVRASQLRREHARQRMELDRALVALENTEQTSLALAASIEGQLFEIRRDMGREESELLGSELLRDDSVAANTSGS